LQGVKAIIDISKSSHFIIDPENRVEYCIENRVEYCITEQGTLQNRALQNRVEYCIIGQGITEQGNTALQNRVHYKTGHYRTG
jgi:hypothetical protein